jgi:hypothetical protein
MKFDKLQLKSLQKFGKNLSDPNFPGLHLIIRKNPLQNVDHLAFYHLADVLANDGDETA